MMKLRNCVESDLETVAGLLKKDDLPFEDLSDHLQTITIAQDHNGELIGIGAIEIYGHVALFRSLVIDENHRNHQYGSMILAHIENHGRKEGVKELYLLTLTARDYFEKRGFTEIPRSDAPVEIQSTTQFSDLCPDSAWIMRKYL